MNQGRTFFQDAGGFSDPGFKQGTHVQETAERACHVQAVRFEGKVCGVAGDIADLQVPGFFREFQPVIHQYCKAEVR